MLDLLLLTNAVSKSCVRCFLPPLILRNRSRVCQILFFTEPIPQVFTQTISSQRQLSPVPSLLHLYTSSVDDDLLSIVKITQMVVSSTGPKDRMPHHRVGLTVPSHFLSFSCPVSSAVVAIKGQPCSWFTSRQNQQNKKSFLKSFISPLTNLDLAAVQVVVRPPPD